MQASEVGNATHLILDVLLAIGDFDSRSPLASCTILAERLSALPFVKVAGADYRRVRMSGPGIAKVREW